MRCAGVLLAAGSSRRFEGGNKLLAPFGDRRVVDYAADALWGLALPWLIAIASDDGVVSALPGFDVVKLPPRKGSLANSYHAGLTHARSLGASHALFVLADMPFLTSASLVAVMERGRTHDLAATTDGHHRSPPVCQRLDVMLDVSDEHKDQGARAAIAAIDTTALVTVGELELADIDTQEDLRNLEPRLDSNGALGRPADSRRRMP